MSQHVGIDTRLKRKLTSQDKVEDEPECFAFLWTYRRYHCKITLFYWLSFISLVNRFMQPSAVGGASLA
ncbi:hypothetical protein RhiirA4_469122 [Rhizophagus irregularis]|uniref:Uncharacterized protein n=1 Tax=Rhizophagus irregularis TaxID=588596 RepID=A0A2I1GZ08_9GLOM|nr:hypothetical protein RhiirA4_469122 [Rhizophagus irregularis]